MKVTVPPFVYWCEVGTLMELHHMTFAEALAYVAERHGVSVGEAEQLYVAGDPALRHNIDGRGHNRNPLADQWRPRR